MTLQDFERCKSQSRVMNLMPTSQVESQRGKRRLSPSYLKEPSVLRFALKSLPRRKIGTSSLRQAALSIA